MVILVDVCVPFPSDGGITTFVLDSKTTEDDNGGVCDDVEE